MEELLKIANSKKPYIIFVSNDFYDEVSKDNPMLFVWLGDKNSNTICITSEDFYRRYSKICMASSAKNIKNISDLFGALPIILDFIKDKQTATKIYNILYYGANNSLDLIINTLKEQPFELTL